MKKIVFFLIALVTFISCSKSEKEEGFTPNGETDSYTLLAKSAIITAAEFPDTLTLCKVMYSPFIAGQNILAGHIYVGNDEKNLYLQISSTEGFQNVGENVKIAITPAPFEDRPAAGHFSFKYDIAVGDTVLYLSFPLEALDLACDSPAFYITIHGDVLTSDEEEPAQTAFGGDIQDQKPWWGYITYTPDCCSRTYEYIERVIALKSYYNTAEGVEGNWVVTGNSSTRNNCLGLQSYVFTYPGDETAYDLYDYWAGVVIGKVTVTPTTNEKEIKVTLKFDEAHAAYLFTKTYLYVGTSTDFATRTFVSGSGTWVGLNCPAFYGFPYPNMEATPEKVFIINL